jgi:hypothetical protein
MLVQHRRLWRVCLGYSVQRVEVTWKRWHLELQRRVVSQAYWSSVEASSWIFVVLAESQLTGRHLDCSELQNGRSHQNHPLSHLKYQLPAIEVLESGRQIVASRRCGELLTLHEIEERANLAEQIASAVFSACLVRVLVMPL